MIRLPPRSTRTTLPFPSPTLFLSQRPSGEPLESRYAMAFDAAIDMAQLSQRADDRSGSGAAEAGPDTDIDGAAPARAGGGRRGQPAPQHLALLRLDVAALWRGYVQGDELCEVAGLGPIPVEAARRLLGAAVLNPTLPHGPAAPHAPPPPP